MFTKCRISHREKIREREREGEKNRWCLRVAETERRKEKLGWLWTIIKQIFAWKIMLDCKEDFGQNTAKKQLKLKIKQILFQMEKQNSYLQHYVNCHFILKEMTKFWVNFTKKAICQLRQFTMNRKYHINIHNEALSVQSSEEVWIRSKKDKWMR